MRDARHLLQAIWRHPANRPRRIRALGTFFAWQFVKHVLRWPVVMQFHGKRLKCYPDSTSTSAALYFSGYPDFWEMKFLQAYLRPGDNFLDVGANNGVYSILASACIGADGHIDAFEPVERTAARIVEQAALNSLSNIHVHRYAVAESAGEVEFGYSSNDAMMHLPRADAGTGETVTVTGTTLDGFEPYRSYAVGKMDIEGAEPLALAGARERLRQANPPVWLLELAGLSNCYGVTSADVVAQLARAGFDCAVFHPETSRLEFTDTPWLLGVQNVLAISSAHRAFVQRRLRPEGSAGPGPHRAAENPAAAKMPSSTLRLRLQGVRTQ